MPRSAAEDPGSPLVVTGPVGSYRVHTFRAPLAHLIDPVGIHSPIEHAQSNLLHPLRSEHLVGGGDWALSEKLATWWACWPTTGNAWRRMEAMAHVLTPNCVKACLRYVSNGQNTCNVIHIDMGAEPTDADLTILGGTLVDWWSAQIKPLTHPNTSLVAIEMMDLSSEDDDGRLYVTGLPLAGTATGTPYPNNVTVCTKFTTGLTGRARRGRTYHNGLASSLIDAGQQQISTGARNALQTAWYSLIGAIGGEGWTWSVLSTILNGVPRTEGLMTPILNAFTNLVLDSQRRRLPERGT